MEQPHSLFGTFSPSEAAECIDEITEVLYQKLWSLHPECVTIPPENAAARAAANWWDRFTAEEQSALNAAAVRFAARYRALTQ